MGMFDSLLISWQDAAVDVQTHHLDDAMNNFRPGDRLVESAQAPGWTLFVESFEKDVHDSSTQRWLLVLLWNGVWMDHTIAQDGDLRRTLASEALVNGVWRDARYSSWGFGRWVEWYADGHAASAHAWSRQWSLLQVWQGGPVLPFQKNRQPLGPLDRAQVVSSMEEALTQRGQQRQRAELAWPFLTQERPAPADPNAPLFAEPTGLWPTGFAPVPLPRAVQTSRWVQAGEALLRGDWHQAEHLAGDQRPMEPVPSWQAALDQTLAALLPSRTLMPLTVRLLAWGARPPSHVQERPLLKWAVEEQGWGLDLLIPLRDATPELDWVGLWPWWGQDGYLQAWADHPDRMSWQEQDAPAWVERCQGEPTTGMLNRSPAGWDAWVRAGGRLFSRDPRRDPLMAVLTRPHRAQAQAARALWLIEHRDKKGWTVPHLTAMTDTLRGLAQGDTGPLAAGWSQVLVRMEQAQLRQAVPRPRKTTTPPGPPTRKRL